MKFLITLGAVFVAQGVLANEVGTQNPQSVERAKPAIELALADKGAGLSWKEEPLVFEATAHQTAKLNKTVEQMNQDISDSLDAIIAEKLAKALSK